jgi:spermidine/putrescine transport system substrate-binding protein
VEYVLPKEGFIVWVDNVCIPATASSPYAAHLFMNFLLDPKNMAATTTYAYNMSPVPDAYKYITDPILVHQYEAMGPKALERGSMNKDLGQFQQYYKDAFAKLKAA